MAGTAGSVARWSMTRDKEGHREYRATFFVETTDASDGPFVVASAAGLPTIGAPWSYGNDFDPWALCWPTLTITPRVQETTVQWQVETLFSTKPLERCQDTTIEDPLQEPDKISGSFVKYTREALRDRNDKAILSSSHEQIRGIEEDANRPTVSIEQNVPSLDLANFSQMVNGVNDRSLWGLAKRKIMLTNVTWSRNLWGVCNFYYTRRFEFEVRFDGFDRDDIPDVGFKEFVGVPADPADPANYQVIKDANGENTPVRVPLLNGAVNPDPVTNPQYLSTVELADEFNFLTLGIPSTL